MRPPWRRLFRAWPLLGALLLLCVFLLLRDGDADVREGKPSAREDWVAVRLGRDQKEYIDKRGVHVVVGHYVGDADNAGSAEPNLTKELINSNLFDPRPNEGKDGQPVFVSPHQLARSQQLFHINRFNLLASDRIPLNRTLPDVRKKRCTNKYRDISGLPNTSVIIVFHNEAWSTLLRTVHSVINRSPRSLLAEILLVDDASDREFLRKPLEEHVASLPVPTRILRSKTRIGLIRARLVGAREARGKVLTFLDAHCECTIGWLEGLLSRIAEDRTRVVCPVIDIISDDTFAYVRSFELHWGAFNWELHFRWYTLGVSEMKRRRQDISEPFRTPAMAGGLFSMDKDYFFELGTYDDKMEIWGGENLELSFRVWMCGGSIEIVPCSHVGHLFRKSSPYSFPGGVGEVLYSNLARVALVWMDDWKEFYFKFTPEASRLRDKQSIRERLDLRKKLQCKSFEWYLDNIWPTHFFPKEDRFFGKIMNRKTSLCLRKPIGHGSLNQPSGSAILVPCSEEPQLQLMFVMTQDGVIATDESVCLEAPEHDHSTDQPKTRIVACSGLSRQRWRFNARTLALEHLASGLCLSTPHSGRREDGLVIDNCTGSMEQQWTLDSVSWK